MDLSEDEARIERFRQQQETNRKTIDDLKANVALLDAELKKAFQVISMQSTIIRRYRDVLEPSEANNVIVPTTIVPIPTNVLTATIEESREGREGREAHIIEHERKMYTSEGLVSVVKKRKFTTNRSTERRIRYLTGKRSDGFHSISIGNTIWNIIVDYFTNTENVTSMDENMIIARVGSVPGSQRTFLNHDKLEEYFNHPFTFQDNDRTITVMKEGMTWVVKPPEWLVAL